MPEKEEPVGGIHLFHLRPLTWTEGIIEASLSGKGDLREETCYGVLCPCQRLISIAC